MSQHEEIQIEDEANPHHWRTEFPNIIYELGLNPYDLALYSHLKRSAGASSKGKCWKSTQTLAAETKMSSGQVSKSKKSLEQKRDELGGKSLIQVKKESRIGGQKPRDIITITDIWKQNFAYFSDSKPCSPGEHETKNDVHHMNDHVHQVNEPCSPGELKKEQIEERTNEEVVVRGNSKSSEEKNAAAAAIWNREEKQEIVNALCKICDLSATALADRDVEEIKKLFPFLKTQMPNQESAEVAAEIERRFQRPTWGKDTSPLLSQIAVWWVRQGRAADQGSPANADLMARHEARQAERQAARRAAYAS